MQVTLTKEQRDELFRQRPETKPDGGFQRLLVGLQQKFVYASSSVELTDDDVRRIEQYAFEYGRGGYETRLLKIFGMILRLK